jgi:hypothetical protein
MATANGAQTVTWEVVYQQTGYDTTPGAPVTQGVTVGFVVDGKTQSSVFIPAGDFTPDKVRARIAAAAANIAAVNALTHSSG